MTTETKQVSRRDFLKSATKTTAKVAIGAAGLSILAQSIVQAAGSVVTQYNFDGNANDSVGTRHGTLVNGPTFVAGQIGQAINLAGGAGGSASQHVTLPTGIVSSLTGDFSIATWVKLDTSASWRRIFDFGTGTTANMFLTQSAGTTVRFAITTSGGAGEQRINGTANLPTGVWTHVAVTKVGNTGTLYVNGAAVGTNTAMTLAPSSLGNTNLNYIGRSQYAGDSFLDGQVDDFRIYNGGLTASEVAALYGGPVATPTRTDTPGGPTSTRTSTPTITNTPIPGGTNLAMNPGTIASTSFISDWESLSSINDGFTPANSADHSHGAYGNWPQTGTQWVQYEFNQSCSINSVAVYWWNDGGGIGYPSSSSVQYWNGSSFVNVQNAVGNGVAGNQFNTTTFTAVTTTRIRLNFTNSGTTSTGILEFRVFGTGVGPTNTPTITNTPLPTLAPGTYLSLLYPESGWKVNSTFWSDRIKNLIVNAIPVHYNRVNNVNEASGGMNNFIQAQRKMAGQSFTPHVGYWFSNAYPYNILQSMCRARMVDAQGDTAIINAQNAMLTQINNWIPIILAAREPDGYLHTWTTLGNNARWTDRAAHEGYTAGYFIEAAIAHYQMTNFTDPILFDAAKKLADCWFNNIGPSPKRTWWDGHQEMEMALTRFSRFCGALGDSTRATNYANLAKFLLDVRQGGGQYDQSHALPINQTTAVGHAVRAMYMYAGMTDVAMLHNSAAYFNAVNIIWNNFVNRKYYITGGVGSGETSEGFGGDYSLPNNSYCETCAGCGNLFFQHMLHLAYADGKYMDLAEEALYNNIVGTMDLSGANYEYTNPLDQSTSLRTAWVTNVPCCAGNYPRTILTMPSWMYSKRVGGPGDALYVNLFVGSTVTFKDVFGSTDMTLIQATNYPWDGNVTLTVNPSTPTAFTLYIRSPQRSVSTLYTHTPSSDGITSMSVNGGSVSTAPTNGYVAINRTWTAGDQVVFTLPLNVQRIKAVSNIAADVGRVALQRGPIIFNIENVDHQGTDVNTKILPAGNALSTSWNAGLLNGVQVITGNFSNGTAMIAIPWYKRYNRGGRSLAWIRDV